MTEKNKGIGDRYQEETKYTRDSMSGGFLDWDNMPEPFKEYPDAGQKIKLPAPVTDGGMGLWQTLCKRRSQRDFSASPLSLQDLAAHLCLPGRHRTGRRIPAANLTLCRGSLSHRDVSCG